VTACHVMVTDVGLTGTYPFSELFQTG
jgi:hypothetical protein